MRITPELLLKAYAAGVFPMAEDRHDTRLFWVDPDRRGILPLDAFHLSRRLRRTVRSEVYAVTVDTRFADIVAACAASRPGRASTWINDQIIDLYNELHARNHAHSVEAWSEGKLVGGLYGVSLGTAFFGESMFSRARDASKVALVHLVGRLIRGGYTLLDTQFVTEHLMQFGTVEISRSDYRKRLDAALDQFADFSCGGASLSADEVLQSITQTS